VVQIGDVADDREAEAEPALRARLVPSPCWNRSKMPRQELRRDADAVSRTSIATVSDAIRT